MCASSPRMLDMDIDIVLDEDAAPARESRASVPDSDKSARNAGGGWLTQPFGPRGFAPLRVRSRQTRRFARLSLNSSFMLGAPMFLVMLCSLPDYLVLTNPLNAGGKLFYSAMPIPFEDDRAAASEALKRTVLAGLYVLTFGLAVFHARRVGAYLQSNGHLVVIVVTLFAGMLYSSEPREVATNTIQIIVGVLMAILFAAGQGRSSQRYENLYLVILLPLLLLHVASAMLLPAYGVNMFSFIMGGERYGGLLGHPNSFGGSAVLGAWAAGCLAIGRASSASRRRLGWFALAVFALSIAMSGSGTAVATVMVLGLLMLWMRALAAFSPPVRFGLNLTMAGLCAVCILAILVSVTPAEAFLLTAEALGKDATLTGRTELWQIARDAISERPWFGWSFDNHESVKSIQSYYVRFNHYHNGFLDTIIAGGYWLLALVLYNLLRFIQVFTAEFRRNSQVFPLILPLIILVIQNLSEYSILRPLSQPWQVYLCAFVLLTWFPARAVAQRNLPRTTALPAH